LVKFCQEKLIDYRLGERDIGGFGVINEDINRLHDASMGILRDVGVAFNSQQALEIFKSHGFKTDVKLVFAKAMSPEKFVIDEAHCRHALTACSNPEISDASIDLRTILYSTR